eukprot:1410044-Pyramimonas_sp.AAC.1
MLTAGGESETVVAGGATVLARVLLQNQAAFGALMVPARGICPLPSHDRCPLQEYAPSPRTIGPRYRNMPPPLAR